MRIHPSYRADLRPPLCLECRQPAAWRLRLVDPARAGAAARRNCSPPSFYCDLHRREATSGFVLVHQTDDEQHWRDAVGWELRTRRLTALERRPRTALPCCAPQCNRDAVIEMLVDDWHGEWQMRSQRAPFLCLRHARENITRGARRSDGRWRYRYTEAGFGRPMSLRSGRYVDVMRFAQRPEVH